MAVREVTIPLVGPGISNRSGDSTDDAGIRQKFVNVFFDVNPNFATRTQSVKCIARPGLTPCAFDVASTAAQGLYYWPQTGKLYAIVNRVIYSLDCSAGLTSSSNLTSTGSSITASASGGNWFDEFYDGSNYYLLIKNVNGELDRFSTADTVTNVSDGDYTGLSAVGPTVNKDGYVFAMGSDGKLANSDINAPLTWGASSYIYGAVPDKGMGLALVDRFVVGFRQQSLEFYVNAGNPSGSVLNRVGVSRVGCASSFTIRRYKDDVYFLGLNKEEGYGVYRIRGTEVQKISPAWVDRYLLISTASSCAEVVPMEGHAFYCIGTFLTGNLAPQGPVYDITTEQWLLWDTKFFGSTPSSGPFMYGGQPPATGVAWVRPQAVKHATVLMAGGTRFGFGATHTGIAFYSMQAQASQVYTDGGANWPISYVIETDDITLGTTDKKINHYLKLVGQQQSTGTVTVSVCDNGTNTFTSIGTVNMASEQPVLNRCGSFRNRRYKLEFTSCFQALSAMVLGIEEL